MVIEMKKTIVFLSVAVLSVMLCSCVVKDTRLGKEEIIGIVLENEEQLRKDIKNNNFEASLNITGIRGINVEYDGTVDFDCGGFGFGPSTSYAGFYYNVDNDMSAIWCAMGTPKEAEGDSYLYESEGGTKRYYTEKIVDGFYYYEAAF